ncbi:MAG: hypothetical protein J6K39_03845 [Clostridia bacterium]|nr:hypothetical protein [Clostridia bacterium]
MKRTYQTSQGLPAEVAERVLKELKLGYLNLTDGFFEQAKLNFLLAAQYDEKCADAYWGQMLVKFEMSNEDELFSNPVKYKSAIYLPECQKALELADETLRKKYDNLLERIYKINEGDNY